MKDSFRFLTLNTWQERGPWQERWKLIFQEIPEIRPDIIVFQEVFNFQWMKEIKKQLAYPYAWYPEPSCGLLTVSKLPLEHSIYHAMKTKSPTEDYFRHFTMTTVNANGFRFLAMNTHLSWKLNEGSIRQGQVEEICQFTRQKPELPIVLAGDFNAASETEEVKCLLGQSLVDSFHQVNPGSRALTWDNRNPYAAGANHKLPDRRIDYVLYRQGSRSQLKPVLSEICFTKPNVEGVYPSDHFGVFTDFEYDV